MLEYALIFLLFVCAIALGWWLGRFQSIKHLGKQPRLNRDYYHGLGSLLNNKADEAVESFIRALEINTDTIPAYLALADLFRRKGEYDRAIEMHKTLLARTDLLHEDFVRIQLSLAKDYQAVGLYERAEGLLQSVISDNPRDAQRHTARRQLAKLYERQQEWELALKTALKLPDSQRADIAHEMAHYACELAAQAEAALAIDTESWLKQALRIDPACVRANLMWANQRIQKHAWRGAIKHLKAVVDQDPRMVPETLPGLSTCFAELSNTQGYIAYLDQCISKSPAASLWIARAKIIAEQQGAQQAEAFMLDALRKHPSLSGFDYLLALKIEQSDAQEREHLSVLRELTSQLLYTKPRYQCHQCGFHSKQLHWQCPSCQSWDTTRLIQGLEGE